LFEAVWLAPALAVLALAGGFVGVAPTPDGASLLRLAALAFFVPALCEELFFRVALLNPGASVLRRGAAIAAFVAWHPLQALFFGAAWAAVVFDPWFLLAVAVLGLAATRIYLASLSVWPSVVLHWLVVVAWKVGGGPSPWS
jgi:predicted Abi (CAAX) family protease